MKISLKIDFVFHLLIANFLFGALSKFHSNSSFSITKKELCFKFSFFSKSNLWAELSFLRLSKAKRCLFGVSFLVCTCTVPLWFRCVHTCSAQSNIPLQGGDKFAPPFFSKSSVNGLLPFCCETWG
jgi:hypothetical protein